MTGIFLGIPDGAKSGTSDDTVSLLLNEINKYNVHVKIFAGVLKISVKSYIKTSCKSKKALKVLCYLVPLENLRVFC